MNTFTVIILETIVVYSCIYLLLKTYGYLPKEDNILEIDKEIDPNWYIED